MSNERNATQRCTRRRFRRKGGAGFTLMEIVLVTAIFAVAIVFATDIFLTMAKVQRKTVSSQRLQGDARFVMELIAKDVRLGRVDYDFYEDPAVNIDLTDPAEMPLKTLALRDVQGELIVYRRTPAAGDPDNWHGTENTLEVCIGDCLDPAASWEVITPTGVSVVSSKFFISPLQDPYTPVAGVFPANQQPLVTIAIGTQGTGARKEEQGRIFLQTTVSTRIYER